MKTVLFIARFVGGIVCMACIAVAAAITVILEILREIISAVWLVLITGKERGL